MALELGLIRKVFNWYGPRKTLPKFGGDISNKVVKTAQWTFTYSDLPINGISSLEYQIPANATIVSARLQIITAFTSTSTTTDLTVGLRQADGTVINDTGLITATAANQTNIGTVGKLIIGDGALVGTTIGTVQGELYIAPTVADLLTGKARLIVEYLNKGL